MANPNPNSQHRPIHFAISTPFRSVRLLEVPDDLLNYITSQPTPQPPSILSAAPSSRQPTISPAQKRLKFKSAPPTTSKSSSSTTTTAQSQREKDAVVHLCTDDKAWAVKQVSTSNSVYLIQPSDVPIGLATLVGKIDNGNGDDDTDMRDSGDESNTPQTRSFAGAVTAVSQIGNFLELHPVPFNGIGVEAMVVDLLPVYHPSAAGEEIELEFQASNDAKVAASLAHMVDDVAAPDGLVRKVCRRLAAFEADSALGPRGAIPSTKAVLDLWGEVVRGCAIEGVKLDGDINVVQILNLLSDETEAAIAEVLLDVGGTFDIYGLFEEDVRKLKPELICRFVAGLLLSSKPDARMEVDEFTRLWTDLVPASFVKYCTVESLVSWTSTSLYKVDSESDGLEVIRWTGPSYMKGVVLVSALVAMSGGEKTGAGEKVGGEAVGKPVAANVDKKRKWHEKFGAQRNK